MLTIAICDDCASQAEDIRVLLGKYQAPAAGFYEQIRTRSFGSGEELLKSLDAGDVFDLFLLDILMPGLDGMELARALRARDADVPVVFLTSSADYALDAFKVSATQYILKPATEGELFPVLDKIIAALKREEERVFVLQTSDQIVKLAFESIICVELAGRTLRVILENGDTLYSKTIRMPFTEAVASLIEDTHFLSPHKSYILNMALVEKLTNDAFVMRNDIRVPVPRYRYAEVKSKYLSYLHGLGMSGGK